MRTEINFKRGIAFFVCLLLCGVSFAQNRTVTGEITDENGNALPNASIYAQKQHSIGTTSDVNGRYSIQIPEEVNNLTFSFVGFAILHFQ